ncbi:hypothetical protein [Bradyrhizobium sp. JR3.5]
MAQIVGIDRNQVAQDNSDDVEKAAVEIQVVEAEEALVFEAAGIIGNDQFAVVMLNGLVVGDRIIPEGAKREGDEPGNEDNGRDIVDVGTADPPRCRFPGQCLVLAIEKRGSGDFRFDYLVHRLVTVA